MTAGQDRPDDLRVAFGADTGHEEGCRHLVPGQKFQEPGGDLRVGSVVEGKGHAFCPLLPPTDDRQKETEARKKRGNAAEENEDKERQKCQINIEEKQHREELQSAQGNKMGW